MKLRRQLKVKYNKLLQKNSWMGLNYDRYLVKFKDMARYHCSCDVGDDTQDGQYISLFAFLAADVTKKVQEILGYTK